MSVSFISGEAQSVNLRQQGDNRRHSNVRVNIYNVIKK